MKIEIINNKIVYSAAFTKNEHCLSLFINHYESYIFPCEERFSDGRLDYIYWLGEDSNSGVKETVSLIAESEKDLEILSRKRFDNYEKTQYHILFLDDKVYRRFTGEKC